MSIFRRKHKEEHRQIQRRLARDERTLRDHDKRLRAMEVERGIYKPSVLKEVSE